MESTIDTEDLDKFLGYKYAWFPDKDWHTKTYYIRATEYLGMINGKEKNRPVKLHRYLMNAKENDFVDHIDHNTLNNCKSNLRITINKKNIRHRKGANSNSQTGVRNVHRITGYKTDFYKVQIMKDGVSYTKDFNLDKFDEACKYAKIKRKELFGEFAGAS